MSDRNKIDAWRSRILPTCLLLIGLASGCGAPEASTSPDAPGHGIVTGMTKAEVIAILGEPPKEKKRTEGGNMLQMDYDSGLRIYLDEGKVIYFEESRRLSSRR